MNAEDREQVVSAQVVLAPAGGKRVDEPAKITAESIDEYRPSPDAVTEAKRFFRDAGFEVGHMVGNSFSVTASHGTFERVFQSKLRNAEGIVRVVNGDAGEVYELPLGVLPTSISRDLLAVSFTPPPDFGPTNFDA